MRTKTKSKVFSILVVYTLNLFLLSLLWLTFCDYIFVCVAMILFHIEICSTTDYGI